MNTLWSLFNISDLKEKNTNWTLQKNKMNREIKTMFHMIRNQKVALKPVSVVGASFCEVERMLVQVNNGLQSSILMQILVTSNLGIVQIQILEYEHNITMLSYYPG